jgi:DNA-binding PadR family transcriptional regulator
MYEGSIRAARGASAAVRLRIPAPIASEPLSFEQSPPRMDVKFPILGFLMEREATGYDLRRRFLDPIGFFYRVSDGSIYPALKKLARDGLVTVRNEKHGRRARKVYAITDQGRARFSRMLREPAEPLFLFDEMQVKVFFGDHNPATALGHVQNSIRDDRARAAWLRKVVRQMRRDGTSPFQRFVVELGQAVVEAKARVLARLATELQSEVRTFTRSSARSRTIRPATAAK